MVPAMTTPDLIDTATPPAVPSGRTTAEIVYDVGTVVALAVGGFVVPLAGWVVGVAMLWNGPRWGQLWRWVGTLAWPFATALGVLAVVAPARAAFWLALPAAAVLLVAAHVALAVAAARAGDRR
jgi:hypothetical protein